MSSLSFQPIQNGPLYQASAGDTQAVNAYWLLLSGTPPAGPIDSAATWNYSGCYIFIPSDKPIGDLSGFISALTTAFAPPQDITRWVAWISDPSGVPGTITSLNANLPSGGGSETAQVVQAGTLTLANIILNIPGGATLAFDATGSVPALSFQSTDQGTINLARNTGIGASAPPLNLTVPLDGPSVGTTLFDLTWDRGSFYYFFTDDQRRDPMPRAGEIRYVYGAADSLQTMHYPFFPPVQQGDDPFTLNISLDPLNVWSPARTIFALDVNQGASLPTSAYFRGTDGHPLTLVPTAGAGLSFCMRPPAISENAPGDYAYLTPAGLYTAAPAKTSHGLAGADPSTIRHMMCGMTGTEYLIVEPGATVEFIPGNAGYAQGFTAPASGFAAVSADPCNPGDGGQPVVPGGLLTNDYTTSWIRINPATTASEKISYGYAVQPESSVYYGTVDKPSSSNDATPYTYPLALGCRISLLEDAQKADELISLPMASYGGVWSTGFDDLPSADALKSFESQIIGTTRHTTAPKDMVNGPTFFDPVTHLGVEGGFGKTPEGLLAELNVSTDGPDATVAGTIKTIFLAKSPNKNPPPLPGTEELSFSGGGSSTVVNPELSNALMNNNLFMVVTNYEDNQVPPQPIPGNPLGNFKNEIQMGEWTFRLDVGYTPDETTLPRTILIFKFTTALSVVDLVANAAYWQEWQTFIGTDPKMVKTVQAQLNENLCIANPASPNYGGVYFQDFWSKVTDPNWTGILAVNCGLDAGNLPADLQDLLGGISGELRAHHFGVTVNQIAGATSANWNIDQSSLFALVHYQHDYTAPTTANGFGFQVLRLNALFVNSVLTHFDSKIAVTIPQLFGENVTLKSSSVSGANVLEIEGVYQKHGDTGTVVFDTKTPQIFSFTDNTTKVRAIQQMYVTDAALVPVSSTTSGGTITVLSNLALTGQLMFIGDVDPAKSGLDIFSYGVSASNTGLGFNSYNVAMKTTITNNVGTLASIAPDLSSFMITPATSGTGVRPKSLIAALPLKLNEFVQGPSDSGWPVEFLGASDESFDADYALSFQVSLGSLGALSAVADSLDVDLILGWKTAGNNTTDNQIWLMMVPPKTMLGQQGFGIQGILNTTFTDIELVSIKWTPIDPPKALTVYGIYFKNVQMQMLGIPLIPGQSNFTLFADPLQGNASNMGWLMTLKALKP